MSRLCDVQFPNFYSVSTESKLRRIAILARHGSLRLITSAPALLYSWQVGTSLSTISLLTLANEIVHDKCGRPSVV